MRQPQPSSYRPWFPLSASARPWFVIVLLALLLGYLGRPPADEVRTGSGPATGLGPADATEEGFASEEEGLAAQGSESGTDAGASGSTGGKKTTAKAAAKGTACAPGKNGGRTDIGVSATQVRLATTAVLDGPAASLLRYSPTGMKAVIVKENVATICGRKLSLQVVNDSFRADLGHQYLRNFLAPEANIFALPVVPSAEGLSSAIQSGDIAAGGMPVVGTDGMRIEQYEEPYVWPVASATVSTMRIIAKYAYQVKRAKTFAIVWDNKYKFGIEGRNAFKDQVKALGGKIAADVALDPDLSSYASQIAEFNGDTQCGNQACEAVVMLLLPDTAKLWLSGAPQMGLNYSAGAQTLFTEKFAQDCVAAIKEKCNGFAIWTGYNPPIGQYATLPGVSTYVNDVKRINPNLDVKNQFLEGSYFGMSLFVEAIKKVGHNLTRENLKKTLDTMDYKNTDIASDLSWRPLKHSANVRARSFSVVATGGSFQGWADEGTGWRLDPAFGG